MLCANAFYPVGSMIGYPCMKCRPCLVNRARIWASRIWLEAQCHEESCFVTLTYDDKKPGSVAEGELCPADTQNWLKRLRSVMAPKRLRFYLVGEYGPQTGRPHYHAVLFGLGAIDAGGTDGSLLLGHGGVVRSTWTMGGSVVSELNRERCCYVAGYVSEKLEHARKLNGKHPEFCRMSLRPGIGATAVAHVARSLESPFGLREIADRGDVPISLQMGRSALPLGRYVRTKLREKLGLSKEMAKESAYKGAVEELLELRRCVEIEAKNVSGNFSKIMVDKRAQKCRNYLARRDIKRARIL